MTKRIFATAIAAAVIATSLPTAGAANALTAVPTRTKGQAVYVGSTRVYPTGYNINDNNYFKLRDVGKLAGFGVDWNEDTRTVEISTTRTAPELTGITDTAVTGATAKPTDQRITVDGQEVSMTAYKIKGNNYVKLRDIGKTINFGVSFNMATKAVSIDRRSLHGATQIAASPSSRPASPVSIPSRSFPPPDQNICTCHDTCAIITPIPLLTAPHRLLRRFAGKEKKSNESIL